MELEHSLIKSTQIKNVNGRCEYMKDIKKYRIDFYFWNCDSGFSHVETYAYKNTYVEAKECVNNINKNIFRNYPHDGIWIKIVDNENDYVVSELWQSINNLENNSWKK